MSEQIKSINVADEMSASFLEYSMSVIISRALPDIRDGLKPSQRRVLYTMHHDLSLYPSKPRRKCAKIVGDTMGNYHPHGDSSIYSTLTNMAQPWSMRETFVDGQGNFGSIDGDSPAAMRYTEAKLTHMGAAMLTDLEKDTVDLTVTYDEENVEPVVLPAAIPNLLVNGGTGIAVGMATNIPAHNLGEVIDGVCARIDNPQISINEMKEFIKGPDFPVACEIRGFKGIDKYFHTGRGSVKMRGVMEVSESKTGANIITITQVPQGVNPSILQQRIAELVKDKILLDISGIRDLSGKGNIAIEITLKREARPQVVVNQIFKLTAMETSFGVNMLAIHKRRPKQISIMDALDAFIEHRREVVMRRTRYLLGKAEDKAENLEAFLLALDNLDDFIKMIRDSKNREEARVKIKAYHFTTKEAEALGILIRGQASVHGDNYKFTDKQVNAILELRLYQLTGMEQDKVKQEYLGLLDQIKDFLDILERESRVLSIIKEELLEIKDKYATPRRCPILPDEGEIAIEDLIANESMMVSVSHSGYIKRTLSTEYRVQSRGGKGVKAMSTARANKDSDDFVEHLFSAQAHDYLLVFTNLGRLYVERVYNLPEGARNAKGRSIHNILDLQEGETIATILPLSRVVDEENNDVTFGEGQGYVFFATRTGRIKKTDLSLYKNHRQKGIIAIEIEEGNELIGAGLTTGTDELVLVTHEGISLKFNEEQARPMGRGAKGVTGIRPREGDYVVSLVIADSEATLLVVSEKGLGKRTAFEEYRLQSRGGKGVITMKCTEKTGKVIKAVPVKLDEELMLITDGGQSLRTRVAEIRETGRNAQGVKLLTLGNKELIKDVAVVIAEEEEEGTVGDEATQGNEEA